MSDFVAYGLKALTQFVTPALRMKFDSTLGEFNTFRDVLQMYEGGILMPKSILDAISENVPTPLLKEMFRTDSEQFIKFPVPHVLKDNNSAWRIDEEFGREMLAGVNPLIIRLLKEFPPASKLDPNVYGNQNSTITEAHIRDNLEGFTINQALKNNRLFILDHHDSIMPYLRRINRTSTKTYSTRTILFLKNDGTLEPLDSFFTSQPRLHDLPPFWQSISIGNGCEAETLTLKSGVYSTRPFPWHLIKEPYVVFALLF